MPRDLDRFKRWHDNLGEINGEALHDDLHVEPYWYGFPVRTIVGYNTTYSSNPDDLQNSSYNIKIEKRHNLGDGSTIYIEHNGFMRTASITAQEADVFASQYSDVLYSDDGDINEVIETALFDGFGGHNEQLQYFPEDGSPPFTITFDADNLIIKNNSGAEVYNIGHLNIDEFQQYMLTYDDTDALMNGLLTGSYNGEHFTINNGTITLTDAGVAAGLGTQPTPTPDAAASPPADAAAAAADNTTDEDPRQWLQDNKEEINAAFATFVEGLNITTLSNPQGLRAAFEEFANQTQNLFADSPFADADAVALAAALYYSDTIELQPLVTKIDQALGPIALGDDPAAFLNDRLAGFFAEQGYANFDSTLAPTTAAPAAQATITPALQPDATLATWFEDNKDLVQEAIDSLSLPPDIGTDSYGELITGQILTYIYNSEGDAYNQLEAIYSNPDLEYSGSLDGTGEDFPVHFLTAMLIASERDDNIDRDAIINLNLNENQQAALFAEVQTMNEGKERRFWHDDWRTAALAEGQIDLAEKHANDPETFLQQFFALVLSIFGVNREEANEIDGINSAAYGSMMDGARGAEAAAGPSQNFDVSVSPAVADSAALTSTWEFLEETLAAQAPMPRMFVGGSNTLPYDEYFAITGADNQVTQEGEFNNTYMHDVSQAQYAMYQLVNHFNLTGRLNSHDPIRPEEIICGMQALADQGVIHQNTVSMVSNYFGMNPCQAEAREAARPVQTDITVADTPGAPSAPVITGGQQSQQTGWHTAVPFPW